MTSSFGTAKPVQEVGEGVIVMGNLAVDEARFCVTVGSIKVDLAYKEFELLKFLVSNVGQVFDRNALMAGAWGKDQVQQARTIDVHVARLRKKLNGIYHYRIVTVTKRGYGFVHDPEGRYERKA